MTVATNDLARVFILPRGVNVCNVAPEYGDCFAVEGLTQDNGDVTRVECPDPGQYGKFIEVAVIRGEIGRLTTTLTRRMVLEELATLRGLFDRDCPMDIHIHWGQCTDPTQFNQYIQAWILETVYVTNWSTDTTIAYQSGDRAPVNEAVDISAGNFYQIKAALRYSQRAATLTTAVIVDVVICGQKSCAGDACMPSDGCDKIYAVDLVGNILISLDGGATWVKRITSVSLPATTTPTHIFCMGRNIYVVYSGFQIIYWDRNEIDRNILTPVPVATTAAVVVTHGSPSAVVTVQTNAGPVTYIGTALGVIFALTSNNAFVLDDDQAAGVASINGFGTNGDVIVGVTAIAGSGVIVNRGGAWTATLTDPTVGDLFAAVAKTNNHWIVAGAAGTIYCTEDGGCTWTTIAGPGVGDSISDLCMSNNHVLWMVFGGSIYRSIDGGTSWVLEPNDSTPGCRAAAASLGTVDVIACCATNPNRVVGVGESATPDAGLILIGE